MDQNELKKLIQELKISADQILREEAEMRFLYSLAKHSLGHKVIFYGGTALRLAYNSPRFSEDIDLLEVRKTSFKEFKSCLKTVIKENPNWLIKDIKNKRYTLFALILVKEEKLKHNFTIKIELHKPIKKPVLNESLLLIKSPTSILEPLILVPGLEKLKTLKIDAIINRKKARDVFDLWYISRILRENFVLPVKISKYNEREFNNELRVFLPKKYQPVIKQLYEQISTRNKKNS